MTTRRPLLTAIAAGTLLSAMWFVPSANATPEHRQAQRQPASAAPHTAGLALADSGSVDTTPYLFGGIAFVAAGGAMVTAAVRRSRTAAR
ncbi:hypothetical protein [Streptomyces griseocarneus]|uniref:hypothetical protein n=1 Tax=Streptomyces griseocarneus TaxID=51201 RepID=UPI00167E0CE7|nr:hypothetical protein [Streptomyces griseocarneus]MBZ6476619.1 hypothetical protein [Streptomyces griseocarneus]GHG79401.1 hypothetical protein GCM10018779_60080 [Streptomyces griseocarneus]